MRQSVKARERVVHRPLQLDDRRRERERSETVARVVTSDEREGRGRQQKLAAARKPHRAVALDQTPFFFGQRNAFAERLHGASRQAHQPHDRVVTIQDLHRCVGENPRLCRGVVGKSRVAIHVVCGDVQHGRRDRFQARRRLELIARQLEDEDIGPALARFVLRQNVEDRVADVARDDCRESRRACERAGERGDGRLAVRAGDCEHFLRRRQRAREKLDVADELGACGDGFANRRMFFRETGTDRDQVRGIERRRGERTRFNGDSGKLARELGPVGRRIACVGDTHVRAMARKMPDERKPGFAESEHDGATIAVALAHRNFSVDRPKSTSSIVMIQKRTTSVLAPAARFARLTLATLGLASTKTRSWSQFIAI